MLGWLTKIYFKTCGVNCGNHITGEAKGRKFEPTND
jgi:hypothetical protein